MTFNQNGTDGIPLPQSSTIWLQSYFWMAKTPRDAPREAVFDLGDIHDLHSHPFKCSIASYCVDITHGKTHL